MAGTTSTFDSTNIASPGFYPPSQTAFLLLDFHTLFVEKAGGATAPAALSVSSKFRIWAKSQGIQVIHCLLDLDSTPFPTCKSSGRYSGTLALMKETKDQEPAELTEGGGDVTFTRRIGHISALKSPGLREFLDEKGIKSLILAGLSTSGCVMRTAVTTCDEEYVVTILSDGCADAAEGVHDMVVGKILSNRGYVVTAAEFQEGYTKAMSGK